MLKRGSKFWFIAVVFVVAATSILLIMSRILVPTYKDKLVFVSSDSWGDIYTVSPDGSGLRNLTCDPANYQRPVWSPDGSKIAFLKNKDYDWQVYVMDSDGTDINPVPGSSSLDVPAGWSPDGKYLLVLSCRNVQAEVYAISMDDGTSYQLTDGNGEKGDPAWSPDGGAIAYEIFDVAKGKWQICIKNLADSTIRKIEGYEFGAFYPLWSPDGSNLLFCSINENGAVDAVIIDIEGKAIRKITDGKGTYIPWCWSADGKQIVVDCLNDENGERVHRIMLYDAGGDQQPRQLVHEYSAEALFYDWKKTPPKGL